MHFMSFSDINTDAAAEAEAVVTAAAATTTHELKIAPSILSADWAHLAEQVESAARGGASLLHVDVMDGHFVPNITVGFPMVKALEAATRLPLDTHLMIAEPGRYAAEFVSAGASMVSVHVEADAHLNRTLTLIRDKGALAGIAINPATSLSALEEALGFADYIVFMSVNPGFGGQKFIPASIDKLRRLRRMIDARGLNVEIEIDGGIDAKNVAEVARAGASIIVAGSAVFATAESPEQSVRALLEAGTQWI